MPGGMDRLKVIFVEALEHSSADRPSFLDRACAGDEELRAEVEAYLADEQRAGEFLSQPGLRRGIDPHDMSRDAAQDRPQDGPGTVIGRYKILQTIGEGGLGTVFLAEQQIPLRRTVALKIIKLGMDTREVITRFEAERQVLALMDHPNIARALDADADEHGRPYFVMEYVPGSPITRYADENVLSIRQRLELMLQVCDAVAHAHAKAVIHRDIKAGNVLAYTTSDGPRVKVIDFGIAKALTPARLTGGTSNTSLGRAVGTYESMSPEQADGSADIDTRTDVYALGVLLYELLSGSKPFAKSILAQVADEEIRRIIREEEPPRPSTQLTSMAGEATKIAKARQIEVVALTRQLRSELDWVPLMALRKQRERRYATPQQMAEDIKSYLGGKPLIAAPDSKGYRLGKLARRHRGPIAAAAAVLAVLLLGITGTTLGLIGEARARAEAVRQRVIAEKATALALKQQEEAEKQAVKEAELAASSMTELLVLREGKDDLAKSELALRAELAKRRKSLPAGSPLIAKSIKDLAVLLQSEGNLVDAEPLFQEALDIRRKAFSAGHIYIAWSLGDLAAVLLAENKPVEAETMFHEAVEICRLHSRDVDRDLQIANYLSGEGRAQARLGKFSFAESNLRGALAAYKERLNIKSSVVVSTAKVLVDVLNKGGKQSTAAEVRAEFGLDSSSMLHAPEP